MESTAGSGRGLGHAVDKSTSVGADSDVYFAVHVDTERRSVNDARCRCQGVSDLPAMVRATRCGGVDGLAMRYAAVLSCAVPAGAAPPVEALLLADMMTARRWRLLRSEWYAGWCECREWSVTKAVREMLPLWIEAR
jgi:hypothetical protein